jgi:hypothetical protein
MLTQSKIGPVALLVLVLLLTLLVVIRKDQTVKEAEDGAVQAAVKLEDSVVRDDFAAVTFIAVMALFAFVTWTFLRTNKRAKESGASGTTDTVG